jgi:cyclophilin family peptidyl-prolyl cis-trans isomerase
VGTDKRERQKANRQARLAELERQQRRSSARKKYIRIGVIVVIALAAAFGLSRLIGRDSSVSTTDTTVPSDSSATTVPPTSVPGTAITGATPCPPADGAATRASGFEGPPPTCIDQNKTYTALVETTAGNFTITLDPKSAPHTVNNFVVLSRYHFYDGTPFHRIVPGFVVQGGDPTGTGGDGPGYTFADELPPSKESYTAGTVAMANSGPDTNGSQFFVVVGPEGEQLPKNYTIFGKVTSGMDVVTAISKLPTKDNGSGENSAPVEPIVLQKVTIAET